MELALCIDYETASLPLVLSFLTTVRFWFAVIGLVLGGIMVFSEVFLFKVSIK